MATMNISLPDDLKSFVDAQVAEHAYGTTSEYLRDLIRKQRDIEKLRGMVMDGLNSGPVMPMEPDFFDRMRQRAQVRASGQ